jgi:hypothetical protein
MTYRWILPVDRTVIRIAKIVERESNQLTTSRLVSSGRLIERRGILSFYLFAVTCSSQSMSILFGLWSRLFNKFELSLSVVKSSFRHSSDSSEHQSVISNNE